MADNDAFRHWKIRSAGDGGRMDRVFGCAGLVDHLGDRKKLVQSNLLLLNSEKPIHLAKYI